MLTHNVMQKEYMSEKYTVSTEDMLEALSRSGYLLEADVAKMLSQAGFFVETCQVIEDPITGKSREIDIIAEFYDHTKPFDCVQVCAKIEFVFEVKNNLFPIVLLNEFDFNPRVEEALGLKEMTTGLNGLNFQDDNGYYASLIEKSKPAIYSQYCSFHKKKEKDELMALHPENLHTGISKIVQYCEEQVELWEAKGVLADEYRRHFLYLPILLINDDLYELTGTELKEVDSSILVVNYHHKADRRMAYVFVITKKGIKQFISSAIEIERNVEQGLRQHINRRRGV